MAHLANFAGDMKKIFSTGLAAVCMALCLNSCLRSSQQTIVIDYFVAGNTDAEHASTNKVVIYQNEKEYLNIAGGYVVNDIFLNGNDLLTCGYSVDLMDATIHHPAMFINDKKEMTGLEKEHGELNMVTKTGDKSTICFGCIITDGISHGIIAKNGNIIFTLPGDNTTIIKADSYSSGLWILVGMENNLAKYWIVETEKFEVKASGVMCPNSVENSYIYRVDDFVQTYAGTFAAITRTDTNTGVQTACCWTSQDGFHVLSSSADSYAKSITLTANQILIGGAMLYDDSYSATIWQGFDTPNNYGKELKTSSCTYFTHFDGNFLHIISAETDKMYINISSGYTAQTLSVSIPEGYTPCDTDIKYSTYEGESAFSIGKK